MKNLKNIFYLALFGIFFLSCSTDDAEVTPELVPEVIEAYEALNVSYGLDVFSVHANKAVLAIFHSYVNKSACYSFIGSFLLTSTADLTWACWSSLF